MMRRSLIAIACAALVAPAQSYVIPTSVESGYYILLALDFRVGEHTQPDTADNHPVDLLAAGVYDSDTKLWWLKVQPGLAFKRSPTLANLWLPATLRRAVVQSFVCRDGQVLEAWATDGLRIPKGLHTTRAPRVSFRHSEGS